MCFHIAQVNLRQRAKVDVGISVDAQALHYVFQRRQQSRELTGERVSADVDVLRVIIYASPCATVDAYSIALPSALGGGVADVVVQAVQRERLIIERQLDGGNTDIVVRHTEANSQRVVALATAHTAYEVHQCGVGKVVLHPTVEVEGTLCGPAATVNHLVVIDLGLHEVFANRHGDFVVAVLVGLLHLAVTSL